MSSQQQQYEATLQSKFRNVDIKVIRYILTTVAAGNLQIAQETLAALPPEQINVLAGQIGKPKATLTEDQKTLIEQFKGIAGTGPKTALKFLENNSWNLELAINFFFSSGAVPLPDDVEEAEQSSSKGKEPANVELAPKVVQKSIEELFDLYKKEDVHETPVADKKEKERKEDEKAGNLMQFDALVAFAKDLSVDIAADPTVLIIAWLVDAKTASYSLSRDEFVKGLHSLGCNTLVDIKTNLPEWKLRVKEKDNFKRFYRYVFKFVTPARRMRYQIAVPLWKMLFPQSENLKEWCEFVSSQKITITQDLWNESCAFLADMQPGFTNYKMGDDAWNTAIDDFMQYRTTKTVSQNASEMQQ